MNRPNTLNALKEALDDAIYTYGQCLEKDIATAELTEELSKWLEMSVDISNTLDAIL